MTSLYLCLSVTDLNEAVQVDADSIDAKLAADGDEALPMYNDIFEHVFVEVLVKVCIGFDIFTNNVHWKNPRDNTPGGNSPFFCVFGSAEEDGNGVVLFSGKTIAWLDFLVANTPWYHQANTECAMDSIAGIKDNHDTKFALKSLRVMFKRAFAKGANSVAGETISATAPKRRRLMMDLSDSE